MLKIALHIISAKGQTGNISVSHRSCIIPVPHPSCPASFLSRIIPVPHNSNPA